MTSSSPGNPLLECVCLGRRHPTGEGWLLADVSLNLRPAERLVLSGPSGSGKSLLLRATALLDPVDCGEVRWLGRPVQAEEVPSFRSQVVYLHQRPAVVQGDVEQSLRQPFELQMHRGRRFDPDRTVALLERLGRDAAFLRKTSRDLSGGELQITALLRALQVDPRVLLLDEPTAALDAATAQRVEDLLVDWVAEAPDRRAMVWVSHDSARHGRIGTSTVEIRGGRVARSR